MIEEIIIAIRTFMEAGGDVLYLIAATTFLMWAIIFERFMFMSGEHKRDVAAALNYGKVGLREAHGMLV